MDWPPNRRKTIFIYGYLVQPWLGSWLKEFLLSDLDTGVVP
jgi:hypothetical protein